jgi:hypothetical protein
MAVLFMEGWDTYTDGSAIGLRNKWSGARNGAISLIAGRIGGNALWNWNNRWVRKDFGTNYSTWICGYAFQQGGGDNREIVNFAELGVGVHVSLWHDYSTNLLKVQRGVAGGTVLGSAAFSPGSAWHYLEFKATVHDTAGVIEVRVDGVPVITLTGQDTRNGGTGVFNQLIFGDGNQGGTTPAHMVDDVYLLDDSGSAPTNTFLGDVRVITTFPNGNGNSSQMVGSDGNSTDNYLLVDETVANDDTDYVESSTVGNKDTYTYSDLIPTSGTIFGIQLLPHVRKTDAGARSMKSIARLSGTEVDGPAQILSTSYQYFPEIRETKPGGGAWTITDINNAEFGHKVYA